MDRAMIYHFPNEWIESTNESIIVLSKQQVARMRCGISVGRSSSMLLRVYATVDCHRSDHRWRWQPCQKGRYLSELNSTWRRRRKSRLASGSIHHCHRKALLHLPEITLRRSWFKLHQFFLPIHLDVIWTNKKSILVNVGWGVVPFLSVHYLLTEVILLMKASVPFSKNRKRFGTKLTGSFLPLIATPSANSHFVGSDL
jgi:hypothetical protein